jgi:hypothetical protein
MLKIVGYHQKLEKAMKDFSLELLRVHGLANTLILNF